jgi:hypothetical protein
MSGTRMSGTHMAGTKPGHISQAIAARGRQDGGLVAR